MLAYLICFCYNYTQFNKTVRNHPVYKQNYGLFRYEYSTVGRVCPFFYASGQDGFADETGE